MASQKGMASKQLDIQLNLVSSLDDFIFIIMAIFLYLWCFCWSLKHLFLKVVSILTCFLGGELLRCFVVSYPVLFELNRVVALTEQRQSGDAQSSTEERSKQQKIIDWRKKQRNLFVVDQAEVSISPYSIQSVLILMNTSVRKFAHVPAWNHNTLICPQEKCEFKTARKFSSIIPETHTHSRITTRG